MICKYAGQITKLSFQLAKDSYPNHDQNTWLLILDQDLSPSELDCLFHKQRVVWKAIGNLPWDERVPWNPRWTIEFQAAAERVKKIQKESDEEWAKLLAEALGA
jgi:hypothetical protein